MPRRILSMFIVAVVGFVLFKAVFWYMDYNFNQTKKEVLLNPVYTKGVIKSKRSYKGKGARIEYPDGKKLYILNTGITSEFYNLYKVGDSVGVVYSKRNPSVSLLEYELTPSE